MNQMTKLTRNKKTKLKKIEKASEKPAFELVIQIRDLDGKPTGKTKTISSDNPEDIGDFWERNSGVKFESEEKKPKKKQLSIIDKIINRLEKNTKLPKGWDDKNGIPLNYNTYLMAARIVRAIEDLIYFMPRVIATSSGAAKIEFLNKKNEKELEITFHDETTIEYFLYDPKNSFQEEKSIGINEIWKLRDIINLFNKNT